jgi:hypothetical protein
MLVAVPLWNQLSEATTDHRRDEAVGEAAWTEAYLAAMQRRLGEMWAARTGA